MATNLDNIIAAIKEVALDNGFTSVQDLRLNLNSNADTELDKLFIRLNGITYSDLMINSVNEEYKLELIIIMNTSDNPISQLKAKADLLLNKLFTTNNLFASLVQSAKITLVESNLTNERDLYAELGGEGVTIKMNINNVNLLGGISCY